MFFAADLYDMVTPQPNTLREYENFYNSYGQNVKMILLENQMFHEIEKKMPEFFLEITQKLLEDKTRLVPSLYAVGIALNEGDRKNYRVSLSDTTFIQKYFDSDISKFINFYTNYQEFLMIYSNFEATMTSYLRNAYNISGLRQKDIVKELLKNEKTIPQDYEKLHVCTFSVDEFDILWKYYTNVRNLLAHSFGVVSKEFLDKNTKYAPALEALEEKSFIEMSLAQVEDELFQRSNLNENDLFQLSEHNLRFFRRFVITLWETVYLSKVKFNTSNADQPPIMKRNTFDFTLYQTQKQFDNIQIMPEVLTPFSYNFHISGYICPVCDKNDFFLYKIKFKEHFDVFENQYFDKNSSDFKNLKVRNAFTCPFCKSFFFPEYMKDLRDNTGGNVIGLDDRQYRMILEAFNEK